LASTEEVERKLEELIARLGPLHRGAPDDPDITISADSDDLVRLIDGEGSLFSAYLSGRVRIEASVSDLLHLRRLV